MRRSIAALSAVLLTVAFTPGAAHAAPAPATAPKGPNPFLALLPSGAKADYAGWSKYLTAQASTQAARRLKALKAPAAAPVAIDEDEPDGTFGSNDTVATAQEIPEFGTGAKLASKIRILGRLDNEPIDVSPIAPSTEDDGSIPLAADTGIAAVTRGVTTTGVIGDGPYGSAGAGSNDYDFYRLTATAGQTIEVATATPTGALDTVVVLYDATGTRLAVSDDSNGSLDSDLTYTVTDGGTYYAAVAGYQGQPVDPFDSSAGTGGGSEGPYSVTITAGTQDTDYYAVKLKPGDVVGASVHGSPGYLTVYDTTGREAHGSRQDASGIYPLKSPLPGGSGAPVTDYVATTAGWHTIGVAQGSGAYDITVEGYRPPLQGAKPVQTVFLDFDGARINTGGAWGGYGNVNLSPFSAFTAHWGLTNAQRDTLIDLVTAAVTENLKQDMVASGLNARFRLKVLNSKDSPDPWGQANVSRIVVGGTIAESGVATIGISQSIDPGNFDTEETAMVLMDELSAPAGPEDSLNTYLTPASDKLAFLGHALGNVIAHEGGHFFGDWHTENLNGTPNIMDAGGENFGNLFGVGPDGVGGTADDVDVDFGFDTFKAAEGFIGTEDTLGRVAFGVTS